MDGPNLAHFNWATLRAPVGDPAVAPFVDAFGRVNDRAEAMPGFVWRSGDEAALCLLSQDFSEAEGDTITLSTDEFSIRVTNAGLVITTTEDRDRIIIDGDFDRDRDEFAFIIVEEALV